MSKPAEKPAADQVAEIAKQLGDPTLMPADALDEEGKIKPGPRPRLKPRPGLRTMTYAIMDIRLRMQFQGPERRGKDAERAVLMLTPEDAEMLEDVADMLTFFEVKWKKLRKADEHWPLVETVLRNKGLL